jgi:hypothetical protein
MNNPGVWVFGSTDDQDRHMDMGVVIEYENRSGEPQWRAPAKAGWDYAAFARKAPAKTPDATISLTFEKVPGGRGGYNRWSSRPEESHPRALPDPCVNLSIHTAPDARPFPWHSCQ